VGLALIPGQRFGDDAADLAATAARRTAGVDAGALCKHCFCMLGGEYRAERGFKPDACPACRQWGAALDANGLLVNPAHAPTVWKPKRVRKPRA
jgi:hypothetical protein